MTDHARGIKNPGRKIRAGHTCPRPFSELFYVAASRPAQIDHGSNLLLRPRINGVKLWAIFGYAAFDCFAAWIAAHTRDGEAGISKWRMP